MHFILITAFQGSYYYHSHFTDEDTDAEELVQGQTPSK